MPMVKKGSTTTPAATVAVETPKAATPANTDNGTAAAINRLQKKTEEVTKAAVTDKKYAGRDFDKEARGKTRCVQFEAALMSPAIAGMKFDTMDDYLKLCKQAADFGTAYTFGE